MNNGVIDYDAKSNEVEQQNVYSLDSVQARTYCLTINNEPMTDTQFFDYCKGLEHIKYFIFSRERGEITGTYHIQMYIEFTISKRMSTVKQYFPRAHIEKRKGSKVQARDYCTKSETHISGPFEFGEFAEERSRTDIKDILEMVKNGATDYEIMQAYPVQYMHMLNKIDKVRSINLEEIYKNKRRDVQVTYIYGDTGVGKTRYVLDKYGYSNVYRVTDYGTGAFDGYNGQDIILFDEYRSQFSISQILTLLDCYPLQLPCRYQNKTACYTKVYIISNIPVEKQYRDVQVTEPESYNALKRRLHTIYYMDKNGVHNQTNLSVINEDDPIFEELEQIF